MAANAREILAIDIDSKVVVAVTCQILIFSMFPFITIIAALCLKN